MAVRRISSRRVVLTTAFLTLAAGGTAACDAGSDYEYEYETSGAAPGGYHSGDSDYSGDAGYSGYSGDSAVEETVDEEASDESGAADGYFYCADDDGTVVDEENCDDDGSGGSSGMFFLWYSAAYAGRYGVGDRLPPGGSRFAYDDARSRARFGLPATGPVGNGTVKTNVVGKGGASAGGSRSSGGSGSAGG